MRLQPRLIATGLGFALSCSLLAAPAPGIPSLAPDLDSVPQALLPTRTWGPAVWGTFLSCVEFMEKWTGPKLPAWVVHSSIYSYLARKPLYDKCGRPLLDDQGQQRCEPTLQSGRVFFPPAWRVRDPTNLPIVIYNHATALLKNGVASNFGGHEWIMGAAAATYYGFAVAMPDLPGMGGDGTSYHPFCHGKSLGYAAVDGIPAIRRLFEEDPYVTQNHYAWNRKIYLVGYSEGGYTALAAAREMETHREAYGGDAFWLAGSACMAGPFDISGTTRRRILEPSIPFQHPFFIPYVIYGYHSVYGSIMDPLAILAPCLLRPDTDGNMQAWCNGSMEGPEVDMRIATRFETAPDNIFLPRLLNPDWVTKELADPGFQTSPLRGILEENDVARGWAPTRPILFCQSPDDRDVSLDNVIVASELLGGAIRKAGRDPDELLAFHPLGTPGRNIGHVQGNFLAIPYAFNWIYQDLIKK